MRLATRPRGRHPLAKSERFLADPDLLAGTSRFYTLYTCPAERKNDGIRSVRVAVARHCPPLQTIMLHISVRPKNAKHFAQGGAFRMNLQKRHALPQPSEVRFIL
jgi:hypothetical protein